MSITNYQKAVSEGFYAGYASITFREDTNIIRPFVLNSYNDGWFRREKNSGICSGYGLCIKSIKITSKSTKIVGKYTAYKCKIEFIDSNEVDQEDLFWLFVHSSYSLDEVLDYIENNKHNWKP